MDLQDHIDLLKKAQSQGIEQTLSADGSKLNPVDAEIYQALAPEDLEPLVQALGNVAQARAAAGGPEPMCNDTYC